jgi:uncharacterized protein YkwD
MPQLHGEAIEDDAKYPYCVHSLLPIVTPVGAFSSEFETGIVRRTMRAMCITGLLAGILVLQTGSVAAAPAQSDRAFAVRVLQLTNGERQNAGLQPLVLSSELNDAAQKYSQVLATSGCFDHTCGPVANFADRAGQAGYTGWTALAENIAAGYPTPEAVVTSWMASPGHRANILSPKYTEMGIGLVSGGGRYGTYWTQEFGSRPARAPNQTTQPEMPVADLGPVAVAADDAAGATSEDAGEGE